ncbi:MAG: 16S rRNA (uracil(1498)-N(3))-methyltransferase [Bacteriovoracaceae bacterium]|jgi:16S rRNA (uracil1498-N3)-methyltransferase|nr:16S rRNA (uracil(1498)-N(3))-methyltransferase [Bacteriovoracaceae bacterium]
MRALYVNNINQLIIRDKDQIHHIKNVLRTKIGEELLLLDGKGSSQKTKVHQISKKEIELSPTDKSIFHERTHHLKVAIGQLKKDAMEIVLKQAVELGIEELVILETKYSQRYELNFSRIDKFLKLALEQSNAPYIPKINVEKFEKYIKEADNLVYMSLHSESKNALKSPTNATLVVGPEGGFSEDENLLLCQKNDTSIIKLPSNILRAQTAMSCGCGYILGSLS